MSFLYVNNGSAKGEESAFFEHSLYTLESEDLQERNRLCGGLLMRRTASDFELLFAQVITARSAVRPSKEQSLASYPLASVTARFVWRNSRTVTKWHFESTTRD